jgi:hypothetical protein
VDVVVDVEVAGVVAVPPATDVMIGIAGPASVNTRSKRHTAGEARPVATNGPMRRLAQLLQRLRLQLAALGMSLGRSSRSLRPVMGWVKTAQKVYLRSRRTKPSLTMLGWRRRLRRL